MSLSKSSKMLRFINYRMRITMDDRRTLVGRFLAFDKHMNVVLADCEEFRRAKKSEKEQRRALGLVLLRGQCVVSIAVESPPPPSSSSSATAAAMTKMAAAPDTNNINKGKRTATVAGLASSPTDRSIPQPTPAGRAANIISMPVAPMQPQLAADPRMYPPPPPPTHPPQYAGRGYIPPPVASGRGTPVTPPIPPMHYGRGMGGVGVSPPPPYGGGRGMVGHSIPRNNFNPNNPNNNNINNNNNNNPSNIHRNNNDNNTNINNKSYHPRQ